MRCFGGNILYNVLQECDRMFHDRMYEDIFSERLAQLRLKKGISAREMSLALGQNVSYINVIENKKAFPSMQIFFYICEYLEITPQHFFDIENKSPQLLERIIADLKKLNEPTLEHVAGIVGTLAEK